MLTNLPGELKAFRQWIVWRMEWREDDPTHEGKPTKIPYNPLTGRKASVTDPATWVGFDVAVAARFAADMSPHDFGTNPLETGFSGVGFVLTKNDPFLFIDLDDTHGDQEALNRQRKIFAEFDSYSELSPSGQGLHIICRGSVPHGRKRAFIEMYSSERYMTMTGHVYRAAPIQERQELADILWQQMGGPPVTYDNGQDQPEREPDDAILRRAAAATNGDKFERLWVGDFHSMYPSQSEADFALIDILAYYTQNRAQICRLFRQSALGQREKAQRQRYLDYMVAKSFDRQLPPVDIEGLRIQVDNLLKQNVPPYELGGVGGSALPPEADPPAQAAHFSQTTASPAAPTQNAAVSQASHVSPSSVNFPPGLVGEIAQFIYDAAPRPVGTIALAAAIGLLAGITGRAYNVSGTGLNQYVLTLAMTGAGKEAAQSGISKLMAEIKRTVPPAGDFLGPGEIVSAPGLIKWLGKAPSIISVVGEFGLKLKEMSSPNANAHTQGVKRILLDLYNKSGKGSLLAPMAYSDKEKNTQTLYSPALTIFGESVPESFYNNLDEAMIADGLLPRFMVFEYHGLRPPLNRNHTSVLPGFTLGDQLAKIAAHALSLNTTNTVCDVLLTPDAEQLADDFDKFCDRQINAATNEVTRQLYNRAHVKALKLAALFAVGENYVNPMISVGMIREASNLINEQVEALKGKFERGEVGQADEADEAKQLREMCKVIGDYISEPFEKNAGLNAGTRQMHAEAVIPFAYLQRRLNKIACFRKDRRGPTAAIRATLANLLAEDALREIPKQQMQERYGNRAQAFVVSKPSLFG